MDSDEQDEYADYSTLSLETIRGEIEFIFESEFYQLFLRSCAETKENLMDEALRGKMTGVESILARELVMGEALAWDNVKRVFSELHESICMKIKERSKK